MKDWPRRSGELEENRMKDILRITSIRNEEEDEVIDLPDNCLVFINGTKVWPLDNTPPPYVSPWGTDTELHVHAPPDE